MAAKRAFDIIGSLVGLAILWPFLLIVSILIVIDSPGPVLFKQIRVGRHGALMKVWKFRSMVADAERIGGALTLGPDPRVTRVGRLLRRLKIDEFPQLVNILRGDMSFVGPRPELPFFVARYTEEQRRIFDLVPGLTDPSSLQFIEEELLVGASEHPEQFYIERIVPEKIKLSLEYASHAGLWSDIGLILRTFSAIGGIWTQRRTAEK